MSRCWAVRERLGRFACRGAAPTLLDLGRLVIILCLPPSTLALAVPCTFSAHAGSHGVLAL